MLSERCQRDDGRRDGVRKMVSERWCEKDDARDIVREVSER
jgi:hypothetical protein